MVGAAFLGEEGGGAVLGAELGDVFGGAEGGWLGGGGEGHFEGAYLDGVGGWGGVLVFLRVLEEAGGGGA